MNKKAPWLFRADADSRIGTGHIMRCLALAQAWQDAGGSSLFVTAAAVLPLNTLLESEGMAIRRLRSSPGTLEDAGETAGIALQRGAGWVVTDGYHFGGAFHRVLKDSGLRLLAIDDEGRCDPCFADAVLNQNLHAHRGMYPIPNPRRSLLGPRYALLRREFRAWEDWKREIPEVARRVLITLGGSDPNNVTSKAIQALKQTSTPGMEVKVVAGAANPHLDGIRKEIAAAPSRFHLLPGVDRISTLMAWADLAISAGGSTCWEMAFMGLPNLAVVLAENQLPIATRLNEEGTTVNLGWFNDLSSSQICSAVNELAHSARKRRAMARRGRELVDGLGPVRVVEELCDERENGHANSLLGE